jgi:hypothetical protein
MGEPPMVQTKNLPAKSGDEERSEILAVAMTRRRQGFTLTVLAGILKIFR